jgi:hypothetical protein
MEHTAGRRVIRQFPRQRENRRMSSANGEETGFTFVILELIEQARGGALSENGLEDFLTPDR